MELVVQQHKNSSVGKIPKDWVVKNIVESSTLKARIGWQGLTTAEYLNHPYFYRKRSWICFRYL